MNPTDLRKKNETELTEELLGLRREQFNLRMQQATGQLVRPDEYRKVRKNIARIKTVLREQEIQQQKAEAKS
jgi:large subunit ribosomal protein L29